MHRFDAQRWLIDNIIRANGIDWDQPRSLYIHGPCGIEANADFAGIRERVKKMADIGPAFAAVARRREAKATAAAQADHKVSARDNFFMAAVHWGAAQWPYAENDETNITGNNKKRECSAIRGARRSSCRGGLGAVQGQGHSGLAAPAAELFRGKLPVVISIPGHGQYKEFKSRSTATSFSPRHGRAGDRLAGPVRGDR